MIIYRCFPRKIKRDLYVMADLSKDGRWMDNALEPLFVATGDPSTWPARATSILSPRHPDYVMAPICSSSDERFDLTFLEPELIERLSNERKTSK